MTPKTRFLVLYQDVTQRLSRIHNITNTPLRTLYDWENKILEGRNIQEIQKGRGRKPHYEELIPEIAEEITENPCVSQQELLGPNLMSLKL